MEIRTLKLQINHANLVNLTNIVLEDEQDNKFYLYKENSSGLFGRIFSSLLFGLLVYLLIGFIFLKLTIKQNKLQLQNGKLWYIGMFYLSITTLWIFLIIYYSIKRLKRKQSNQSTNQQNTTQNDTFSLVPGFIRNYRYREVENDPTA